jgi:hypothetical protein
LHAASPALAAVVQKLGRPPKVAHQLQVAPLELVHCWQVLKLHWAKVEATNKENNKATQKNFILIIFLRKEFFFFCYRFCSRFFIRQVDALRQTFHSFLWWGPKSTCKIEHNKMQIDGGVPLSAWYFNLKQSSMWNN